MLHCIVSNHSYILAHLLHVPLVLELHCIVSNHSYILAHLLHVPLVLELQLSCIASNHCVYTLAVLLCSLCFGEIITALGVSGTSQHSSQTHPHSQSCTKLSRKSKRTAEITQRRASNTLVLIVVLDFPNLQVTKL
ncbi:hypothetical protein OJAV_G00233230 [Oryzias javanicus]|uniref:G-protein coupled receptors family 1 profile domain-containing protein n=1 Tax=Oryzias javanicus TaxID=123683 RepID=A0A3S2NTM0_ORYJA|nr:hypothetical protein OJAV_G00233230 [Oryzias javanicus]